jgi:quercetin dioxygenase-like cupin family protein
MKSTLLPLLGALVLAGATHAATLDSATVTRVYNDVRIYPPGSSAKPATVGSTIRGRTSLQTGRNSRSELRFQDDTLTRLGQNSVFSFQQGTRDLQLEQGTLLLQVPKRAGGARIRTATVTAAITGTTVMMEYHKDKWCKIIVLEGTLDAYLNKGQRRVTIKPGQMLVMPANAQRIPKPVDVDVQRLQKTSKLAGTKVFPALPDVAQNRINQTVAKQQTMIKTGALAPPKPRDAAAPDAARAPVPAPEIPPAIARTSRTVQAVQAVQNTGNSVRVPQRELRWWERRPRTP